MSDSLPTDLPSNGHAPPARHGWEVERRDDTGLVPTKEWNGVYHPHRRDVEAAGKTIVAFPEVELAIEPGRAIDDNSVGITGEAARPMGGLVLACAGDVLHCNFRRALHDADDLETFPGDGSGLDAAALVLEALISG